MFLNAILYYFYLNNLIRAQENEQENDANTNKGITVWEPTFLCIEGFTFNNETKKCTLNDVQDATLGCADGWDYDGENCLSTKLIPAGTRCPANFVLESNMQCSFTQVAPLQILCPEGSTPSKEGCIKSIETDLLKYCEEGIMDDNGCTSVEIARHSLSCNEGYVLKGNYCIQEHASNKLYICKNGYELVNNNCISTNKLPAKLVCPLSYAYINGECVRKTELDVITKCPVGFNLNDNNCEKIVKHPAKLMCPEGFEDLGKTCAKKIFEQPISKCIYTGKESFKCDESTANTFECPNNFELVNKNICMKMITSDKVYHCPAATTIENETCLAIDFTLPIKVCPNDKRAKNNEYCEGIETVKPIYECAYDFIYDAKLNECVNQSILKPIIKCDKGFYNTETNKCVVVEISLPQKKCEFDFEDFGEYCKAVKVFPFKYRCPNDMVIKDDKCVALDVEDGIIHCLPPFVQEGNVCVHKKIVAQELYCKVGILSKAACVIQEKQTPMLICSESYKLTRNNRTCSKLLISDPVIKCGEGNYDKKVRKCYSLKSNKNDNTSQNQPCPTCGNCPTCNGEIPETKTPNREKLLPLKVPDPVPTTTTTPKTVALKVIPPASGKLNFVPTQIFQGPQAMQQTIEYELRKKLLGSVPVYAPIATSI